MKGKATSPDLLNEREQEILKRLSTGLSDQQIADELFLSPNTIKWYNRQIYSKLGVKSRTQAIACVKDLGLLESRVSTSPHPVSRSNLPPQTLLFIGRSREIAEVKQLLDTSRLLTLTGTGGTGKTQLALRVAAEEASAYADGVCFVDLTPLSDYTLVAKAIASVLGVVERPMEPLPDTLKRALAQRELLLLIDNFEHVIKAAPLVSKLLTASSRLKVLVTSREPLRIAGEQEYLIPPLSLPLAEAPSVESLTKSEAGLLFLRRAQMTLPRFTLNEVTAPAIGRICIRLDGLPLAIELAAARCKLFTPQALLERLEGTREGSPLRLLAGGSRDAPPRQRTLRDSIEWSYNLLDEDEKHLLARLAVFRGGCSLEAIERICGEGLSIDVLDGLTSLVDKHLVQQKEMPGGESHFVMLEMIQEYARERLKTSGEEETTRRRHAEYFVELAERAEPELRLAGYDYWSGRLELDMENIRAVLSWSLSSGDVALGIRLAGALCLFWYGDGYHVEGRRWTQQLLERLDEVSLVYHPKFLLSAGHLAFLYDLDAGKPLFRRALEISRDLGDRLQMAWALALLGYTMLRERSAAMPLVEESLALFRELSHQPGMAQALNIMGEIARFSGDDDLARHAYEECLAVSQQTGETRRIVFMYNNLTYIALHEGEAGHARDLGRQGLQLSRAINNRLQIATDLALLAGAVSTLGQPQQAARLLGASERALERLGAFHQPNDKREIDGIIATVRAQLDEETFQATWAQGRELTLEQAVAQALDE
ncbi:LuxR C-terminal-related transcriptional regulator [Ktedonobacter racemifer]|uniref:Transcriptional regulator, LuxR family n=1 Tax=Ktedonobacter racemifer DSM 44963 TaxID=485913 RepID=D6TI77_KTERA|nr:LuxR C-terminal-related transcriptional regulator [Ktedonobacter racemifer]EFH89134.1 transcriptional regulator, LuxR family [Ktedonobacter racemifer DSM 44963]